MTHPPPENFGATKLLRSPRGVTLKGSVGDWIPSCYYGMAMNWRGTKARSPRSLVGRVNTDYGSGGPGSFGYGRSGVPTDHQSYHNSYSDPHCRNYDIFVLCRGSKATVVTRTMLSIIPFDLAVTGPRTSRLSFSLITMCRSRYLSFPFLGVLTHRVS